MKKIFILVSIIIFFGNSYCLAKKPVYDKPVWLSRVIFNFHVITPDIMRGSQPSEEGLRLLRNCGVKTILNLRSHREDIEREKAIAEKLGLNFINIPMHGNMEQGAEIIEQCLDIINDKSNQPIFVHCLGGKDRTGLIFAAYRIKYDNWTLDDALMEMLAYGYDRIRFFNLEESLIKWVTWREKISE